MKERFREALIARLEAARMTSLSLSGLSGVPKTTIDKLRQRAVTTTNVHDAIRIAKAFGMTVEQFMNMDERSEIDVLAALALRLNPDERAFLQAQLEGMLARRRDG